MLKSFFQSRETNPILKSSVSLGLITLGVKLFGYAEKLALAYFFGTSYQVDVYNVVVTLVLSVFFFFREIIEPGYLNVFLKALRWKDDSGAWGLFNSFILYVFIASFSLTVIVHFYSANLISLVAPGFSTTKRELAVKFVLIAFPACIFLSLSTITNITLNALKRFALPASADLAFKFFILLFLIVLYRKLGIYAALIGFIVGSGVKLCIHFSAVYKEIVIKRITYNSVYLKETWKLTWPVILGALITQISGLIDNIFASFQQEGAISALSYSKKIIELPLLIFPYILSVVVFPYFADYSILKDKAKLERLLQQSLSWLTLIFLPLSFFFYLFSYEIVEVFFKRGAFTNYSTLLTALPLKIYSLGMLFFAAETILVVFYFANSNTKTPIFIGILCVIENIILTIVFVKSMGYVGIALALVCSKATKVAFLILYLKKNLTIDYKSVGAYLAKIIFACIFAALVMMLLKWHLYGVWDVSAKKAAELILILLSGAAAYTFTLLLVKINRSL